MPMVCFYNDSAIYLMSNSQMIANRGITEIATEIHQIQVFPSFLSFFLFMSFSLLLKYVSNMSMYIIRLQLF